MSSLSSSQHASKTQFRYLHHSQRTTDKSDMDQFLIHIDILEFTDQSFRRDY